MVSSSVVMAMFHLDPAGRCEGRKSQSDAFADTADQHVFAFIAAGNERGAELTERKRGESVARPKGHDY
jgi:hypothetical protein